MKRTVFILSLLLITRLSLNAQVLNPVSWKFSAKHLSGNTYELQFIAKINSGWHMYGLNIPEGGPIATSFKFDTIADVELTGTITSIQKPVIKYDPTFEMDLELFDHEVTFNQRVTVLKNTELHGSVEFMVCDDSRCLPPKEESFSFTLKGVAEKTSENVSGKQVSTEKSSIQPVETASDTSNSTESAAKPGTPQALFPANNPSDKNDNTDESLFRLFLLALIAGFGALLTPCVYPIIPLTVTFFMRDSSRSKAIFNGLFFGLSIVFIYTLVGLLVGLTQVDLVRLVSSHWLPNIIFFLIFIALAFSFFGMYEITLPGSISNKIDQQADKGGFMGPFFMALATVIISFSCTGPIVGIVLGGAMQGELIKPVIGMLGFSISFALPFTLLALFPGFLKKIPRSGGWLNAVKVFFAFIMLAFSLVFLGNLGLPVFSRKVILISEAVIFSLLGLYLLGKIRFSHDSDMSHLSVVRLLLAILSFVFAIYLLTGLSGTALNLVDPFLPANEQRNITKTESNQNTAISAEQNGLLCTDKPKYSEFLQLPYGLKGYFDYDEALACARELNKPVLLDFAGHYCKNCKKMYAEVWSDPQVQNLLRNNFVIASLYTDDRTDLPQEDWVTSSLDGKVKKTIGKKFNDLQITKFGTNALPLYVIVNSAGQIITNTKYYTYSSSADDFISFLNEGINKSKE